MNRRTTSLALIAILIPSVCFAWGRDGHRIVGNIAAKYLTPQAGAAVKFSLIDEHTRECLALVVDRGMKAARLIQRPTIPRLRRGQRPLGDC